MKTATSCAPWRASDGDKPMMSFDDRLTAIETVQRRQASDITDIKSGLAQVIQMLSRINGRMEEHGILVEMSELTGPP